MISSTSSMTLPEAPLLPPCRVCNAKSTGLHYGVMSCDACKSFYRRCVQRKTTLHCRKNSVCVLDAAKVTGRTCLACRYQKCISVGMAITSARHGRYSHEMRTEVTHEVKKLEVQSKLRKNGSLVPEDERSLDLDKVIDDLTNIHLSHLDATPSDQLRSVERYVEKNRMEEMLFGKRGAVLPSEYMDIYQSTGLDIDSRRDKIKAMLPAMNCSMVSMAAFADKVPGFRNLPPTDQQSLIKASSIECWNFQFSSHVDFDLNIYQHPYNPDLIMSFDDHIRFAGSNPSQMEDFYRIIYRTQQLDLTREESNIAAALCLMSADTELSEVAQKISSASADFLLEAFQYLIDRNHDPEDQILPKVITLITDLRPLKGYMNNYYKNFVAQSQGMELPKLFLDIHGQGIQCNLPTHPEDFPL